MMQLQCLDELFLDVLKEVGNIGGGSATTALSTLLNAPVDMAVPRVGVVPLCSFAAMLGGPEALAAGVYLSVEGDAPGHIAFVLQDHNAWRLADAVLMQPPGTTVEIGEMESSALMEVGNILTGAYLVAISELTQLHLLPSPPALAVDMTGAILSAIAVTMLSQESDDDEALAVITEIGGPTEVLHGYMVYIPEPGSIDAILRALNITN